MSKQQPPPYNGHSAPSLIPPPDNTNGPRPHQAGPPPQPQQTPVVISTPVGPYSMSAICPYCHVHISTTVKTEANTNTHLLALLLCFGFSSCCCCFLPHCMSSCKSQKHSCPNCHAFLGKYSD